MTKVFCNSFYFMTFTKWRMVLALGTFVVAGATGVIAGPVEDITSFSAFKQIDLNSLASGTILTQRCPISGTDHGLAVQSCFMIPKPVDAAAQFLIWWDPTPHSELAVYWAKSFKPGDNPKFEDLKMDANSRAFQNLLSDMSKAKGNSSELQFSQEELQSLRQRLSTLPSGVATDSPEFRQMASEFWASLIKERYNLFLKGGFGGLPQYDYQGQKLSVQEEVKSLFNADPNINREFSGTIQEILSPTPPAPAQYYWQLFKADTEAAFCLGAVYSKPYPEKTQIVDSQLYVSNAYFTSVTMYELFPVTINGKAQTLIWRCDFVSAPVFVWLKGVEQMAAGMLMMQEIKQSVRFFQQDAAK